MSVVELAPLEQLRRREVSVMQEGPCFTGCNKNRRMCLRQCEVSDVLNVKEVPVEYRSSLIHTHYGSVTA